MERKGQAGGGGAVGGAGWLAVRLILSAWRVAVAVRLFAMCVCVCVNKCEYTLLLENTECRVYRVCRVSWKMWT